MPYTNPFFSNTTGYEGEISLIDDMVREQIKMFGVDILYMPRYMVNLDRLLHEATKSVFEVGMSMPMYIKSFDGYDNSMEMLTKFGVRSSDELTFVVSRSEWGAYYAPFVKSYYNAKDGHPPEDLLNPLEGQTALRPKEGDLIYFPFDDSLFELKYVLFDQPFFQLGKGYIYELQCEKFEFSGETFSTGIDRLDEIQAARSYYRMTMDLEDGGSGSFKLMEEVTLYNVTDLTPPADPDATPFRLYNDSGFLEGVPTVRAKVMGYDEPKGRLKLGDFTNLNPEQQEPFTSLPAERGGEYPDEGFDVTRNNFDKVLIVGEGASWVSKDSWTTPQAFNDEEIIQEEFDQIKIVDVVDQSPFGFV